LYCDISDLEFHLILAMQLKMEINEWTSEREDENKEKFLFWRGCGGCEKVLQ
jgi:hypothetical protein